MHALACCLCSVVSLERQSIGFLNGHKRLKSGNSNYFCWLSLVPSVLDWIVTGENDLKLHNTIGFYQYSKNHLTQWDCCTQCMTLRGVSSLKWSRPWQEQSSATVASALPAGWQNKAGGRGMQGKMLEISLYVKLCSAQNSCNKTASPKDSEL